MSTPCGEQLDELLVHLIEEAAEVIQACTKMKRFGPEGTDYRIADSPTNAQALAFEMGQLLVVWSSFDGLGGILPLGSGVEGGWQSKFDKLNRYLEHSTLSKSEDGSIRTIVREKP